VPDSVAGKNSTSIVVEGATGRKQARTVAVLPANPGIYTKDNSGLGDVEAAGMQMPGTDMGLFITGAGRLDSEMRPVLPLTCRIGGRTVEVLRTLTDAGLPGVIGVLVRIPEDVRTGEKLPVSISAGGFTSAPGPVVTIAKP
jgi:uncharacterized protein (TIGR03437 family)